MKKLLCLILCLAMFACLCACGSTESSNSGSDNTGTAGGYKFTYNGTTIAMSADAAPIVAALGEPKKFTEEASCAFTGMDKTYFYGSYYIQTYPMGDKDYIYGVWFADDSVSTPEGVYIGAAQAEVEKAYGADTFNGTNSYGVKKTAGTLTVILTDGVVSSIQYAINLD